MQPNPVISRRWDPDNKERLFQFGNYTAELVSYDDNDYGYCYQGAVMSVYGKLCRAEFWGPLGDKGDIEQIILRLDMPV